MPGLQWARAGLPEPGGPVSPAMAEAGGDRKAAPYLYGVLLRRKGRRYCLLVDELVEELDLVIKPLAEMLNSSRLFSGVSVLGDGRVVFILDTARIVELQEQVWADAS